MIDPVHRRRYARLLRALATGRLTNYEYEAAVEKVVDFGDVGIREIYWRAWLLYDDTFEHRCRGYWALHPQTRRAVANWLLFLYSDLEFNRNSIKDPAVWPFPNKKSLDSASSGPVRFRCGEESLGAGLTAYKTGRVRGNENIESWKRRLVPSVAGSAIGFWLLWAQAGYSPQSAVPILCLATALCVVMVSNFSYIPLDRVKIKIWQFLVGLAGVIALATAIGLIIWKYN